MSVATSTLRRRTMPRSITQLRAALENSGSAGVRPVSSSRRISSARGFVSSIHPRNCQMARKSSMSLISGVPVRAINSGRAVRDRIRSESPSTCRERCEVLFLMKCASSMTMPRSPNSPSHPTWRSSTS
jgi:hypothetical protein